jgi:hypothetical protein
VTAVGEGKRDARAGLAGMAAGAFLYVIAFDLFDPALRRFEQLGPVTWPSLAHSSPWPWVAVLAALATTLYLSTRLRAHRGARPRG